MADHRKTAEAKDLVQMEISAQFFRQKGKRDPPQGTTSQQIGPGVLENGKKLRPGGLRSREHGFS